MSIENRSSRPRIQSLTQRLAAATVGACVLATAAAAGAAAATRPAPEIVRPTAPPQAIGAAHTLRTIPEACTRLEGHFTGDAAAPYALEATRSRPNCQPRARFVDASRAKPLVAAGWVLNDRIRIPNASCPLQEAVVLVWRMPAEVAPPKLDAQGRARLYLQDAQQAARAQRTAPVPQFTAELRIAGSCG